MKNRLLAVITVATLSSCGDELPLAECGAVLESDYVMDIVGGGLDGEYTIHAEGGYTATHIGDDGMKKSCPLPLLGCKSSDVDLFDLRRALARPDVLAAFDSNIPIYGANPAGTAEPLITITRSDDKRDIQIGIACKEGTSCTELAGGVEDLRSMLKSLAKQQEPDGVVSCEKTMDASVVDTSDSGDARAPVCTIDQDYRIYYDDGMDAGLNQLSIAADGAVRATLASGASTYLCSAVLPGCDDVLPSLSDVARVTSSDVVIAAFESGLTYGVPNDAGLYYVLENSDNERLRIGTCATPTCSRFPTDIVAASNLYGRVSQSFADGGTGSCVAQ